MTRWLSVLACLLVVVLPARAQSPGFAVVELFTSEGCSSCPPADEALSQLVHDAVKQALPVYALEWHVDYWDYLGWKDPWGSHYATQRQYAYARSLPSSVYTPQVVINGGTVPRWAGDLSELRREAIEASSRITPVRLTVDSARETGGQIRVQISESGAPAGSVVLVAEVEGDLGVTPSAGENAGRPLLHSSVVRASKVVPAVSGEVVFPAPTGIRASRRQLIAVVQDSRSMQILAAGKADVQAVRQLSGRVTDQNGKPIQGVLVQACSGTECIPGRTDGAGYFRFVDMPAGDYEMDFSLVTPTDAHVQFLEIPATIRVAKTVWFPTQS